MTPLLLSDGSGSVSAWLTVRSGAGTLLYVAASSKEVDECEDAERRAAAERAAARGDRRE